MKQLLNIFLPLFLTIIIFGSCQKVISVKVKKSDIKYVIEGVMSDKENDCNVSVTTSINLDEPNVFRGVSNAIVSISENGNTPVLLTEKNQGTYETKQIRAIPGNTYTLKVVIDNKEYLSTVTVPQKVNFDSLYIIDFRGFGNVRKFANIEFKDPAGIPNSYRFIQYKNNVKNANIFILNDDFSDGNSISNFLAYFDDSEELKLSSGDTVTVEMQCTDASVYKYFNSLLQSSTGGNEVVAPGNPVTNISGGALGYFNAFIKQEKTVIVP